MFGRALCYSKLTHTLLGTVLNKWYSSPLCALGKGYYARQGARGLLRLDFCSATIQIALDYKQGTLASVFICFLGSQAMTNTTLPVTEVTKGDKDGGMEVSQR